MSKKILVVGATGMLGTPVARKLLTDGFSVRVLARNPEKAAQKLGDGFEYVPGDVENPESLRSALAGCDGVHINLAGGSTPEEYDRIEHRGTANVAQAAQEMGARRLTYLSGTSVRESNTWFYETKAKYQAEQAIITSGAAYTIFRASWFYESLPLFVRGKSATMIGKQPHPIHWLAADDYARMVSRAYQTPDSEKRILYLYGPEAIPMTDALRSYCAIAAPEAKISSPPSWLASLFATLTGNSKLKDVTRLLAYYEKFQEDNDPGEANTLLGKPTTTLEAWSESHLMAN